MLFKFISPSSISAAELAHHGNIYLSGVPATAIHLGLDDQKIDFPKPPEQKSELRAEVLVDIDARVKAAGSRPVLLFCRTGDRAAAWLAVHLVRDEHYPLESALNQAGAFGLREDMESAVRAFPK